MEVLGDVAADGWERHTPSTTLESGGNGGNGARLRERQDLNGDEDGEMNGWTSEVAKMATVS